MKNDYQIIMCVELGVLKGRAVLRSWAVSFEANSAQERGVFQETTFSVLPYGLKR